MADHELLEAFNDCIDRIADGQSINDCLRYYPQYADALRPMLEVGKLIERVQVSPFEVATAQMRVRARVSESLRKPLPARRSYVRFVALAASLLIAFVVLFGAAENSLPGDPLYGIKRFTENARSAVTGDQFGQRRLDEIRVLLALRRSADVEFTGEVEQIIGSEWRISGIDLRVGAGITGAVVGDRVRVVGYTTDRGELIAVTVEVLRKGEPPLLPTLEVLPSATSTQTNIPSPTATPTSTPMPTSTAIPSPMVCATMQPQGWVRYVVQSGDTVGVLASVTGASVEQVLAVNCLSETQMIIVGQTLFLPSLPPTFQPGGGQSVTSTPDEGGGDDDGDDDSGDDHSGEGSGSDDHGGESGPD